MVRSFIQLKKTKSPNFTTDYDTFKKTTEVIALKYPGNILGIYSFCTKVGK